MVPAGFGQNCNGTWRMKTQRELESYTFRFFWSMAILRNGLTARYCGLRVKVISRYGLTLVLAKTTIYLFVKPDFFSILYT